MADSLFKSIDPIAERVRKIGGTTIRSVSQIQKLTAVVDNNEDYVSSHAQLSELLNDFKALASKQRLAKEACDANRDYGSSAMLDELLDESERRVWFLYETVRGAENMD